MSSSCPTPDPAGTAAAGVSRTPSHRPSTPSPACASPSPTWGGRRGARFRPRPRRRGGSAAVADELFRDASVLVKLVIEEPDSTALRRYLHDHDLLASSRIVFVEVRRALMRHNRTDPRLRRRGPSVALRGRPGRLGGDGGRPHRAVVAALARRDPPCLGPWAGRGPRRLRHAPRR